MLLIVNFSLFPLCTCIHDAWKLGRNWTIKLSLYSTTTLWKTSCRAGRCPWIFFYLKKIWIFKVYNTPGNPWVSTKNVSTISPAVLPAIGNIYIYVLFYCIDYKICFLNSNRYNAFAISNLKWGVYITFCKQTFRSTSILARRRAVLSSISSMFNLSILIFFLHYLMSIR